MATLTATAASAGYSGITTIPASNFWYGVSAHNYGSYGSYSFFSSTGNPFKFGYTDAKMPSQVSFLGHGTN